MTEYSIPELSLVLLVGVSGSGKSTFAARHFAPTEVLSSDAFRAMVSDDANDQSATRDAFDALHFVAGKRLAAGRLTVVDATNVQPAARRSLIDLAKEHDALTAAIVLDVPVGAAIERNASRTDRDIGPGAVKRQRDQLRRGLKGLRREGFHDVHVLLPPDIEDAVITRRRLFNDQRERHGPFDLVGDVHGCRAELEALLGQLGWAIERDRDGRAVDAEHPDGRVVVFVGDLVDRGPDTVGVLRLVMGMVESGHALCVAGNHEAKLARALAGRKVTVSHGLETTLAELDDAGGEFRHRVRQFADDLVAHYVLDDGRLVVAHAGLKEKYHGRASGRVRAFALYGDTSGETDEYGLPVRYPWANDYRGRAMVVYGHTPVPAAEWVNNTICLDTGCVFGGQLTALRYPERELVSVPAERTWYEPVRPLAPPIRDAASPPRLSDVLGPRTVETVHLGRVSLRAEHAAGALEVMSRFALTPEHLVYLPPTMSPCDASDSAPLERPERAFDFFARGGVEQVVCEEKHMGSRAVLRIQRDGGGVVHTRTGRAFLDDPSALLAAASTAAAGAGLFDELGSDWLLLDTEILPWSAKAAELIDGQYRAVGGAGTAALSATLEVLQRASTRGLDVAALTGRVTERLADVTAYAAQVERYVWPVDGLDGLQIAPFQLLAAQGSTFETRDHLWHLDVADRLARADGDLFRRTGRVVVATADDESRAAGTRWWTELTDAGGEGMVVKPLANLTRSAKGLVQPGVKVRGPEYLRLIYGPEYTRDLAPLSRRNLGHKRSMALREYALGLEALRRHVTGEPLWRVHECVFAILALESEPVDPRL